MLRLCTLLILLFPFAIAPLAASPSSWSFSHHQVAQNRLPQDSAPKPPQLSGLEETLKRRDVAELRRVLQEHPKWLEAPVGDSMNWVTPLGWCAARGETDLLKVLLDAGARVDRVDRDTMTPLFRAALFGHHDAARLLLDAGADPNQVSENLHGHTAIDHAASRGDSDMIRLLREHGADVNGHRALERALTAKKLSTVKLLLEDGADPNRGYAMVAAAEHAPLEILTLLVQAGGDVNQQSFESVLAKATRSLSTVKYLVKHGAQVNSVDGHGRSALHAAAFAGAIDVAKFLIDQGAKVDVKAVHRQRPIDTAIHRGHAPMVKLLLRHGAKPSFHSSVALGENAQVEKLLQGKTELRDSVVPGQASDLHPIHVAIAFGQNETLEILLTAGASADTKERDVSALHLAVEKKNLRAVTTLLAHAANPNAQLLDHRYGSGLRTPLHFAVESFLTKEGGNLAIVARLLAKGANPDVESEMQLTPLELARQSENEELLKLFGEAN